MDRGLGEQPFVSTASIMAHLPYVRETKVTRLQEQNLLSVTPGGIFRSFAPF